MTYKKNRQLFTSGLAFILAFFSLIATSTVDAYDVEADSVDNTVYILLRNLNAGDSYDSINIVNGSPTIVSSASATIVPASVAAAGSDLAAVDFTVSPGAMVGETGDLTITVTGTIASQSVSFDIVVPLTVVANAPSAQGVVGSGIPTPDPGGVDSDSDGVSDALEVAFGSDPNNATSQPGDAITSVNVPMLGALGLFVLAALIVGRSSRLVRRQAGLLAIAAFIFIPTDLIAGSATRIQLIAEIPVPPPLPQLLTVSSATASNGVGAFGPNSAIDGNMGTRWGTDAADGDPQWLALDLGAVYDLSETIINWEAANASTYEIQGSNDNSNWTTLAYETGGTFGDRTDTVALSGSYRYVRMYGLTRSSVYGYSIWEIAFYGLPAADADNDGVSDAYDLCPATPMGASVASNGCPDSDGDGVDDNADQCPATPTGSTVDANGCVVSVSLLTATATASTAGAAGAASLAVDGNMQSRWESSHGIDPSWITLDLGAQHDLVNVMIHWEAANAATYEIRGSNDNSSWTTLASESGGLFGNRTDDVDITGSYRYVQMYGLTRAAGPGGAMYGYSIYEMEVYGTAAADADGDGVSDSADLCPGTPVGSTVDATGCVIVDSDGDGVPDGSDQCPGTPPGANVDATGCIIIIPVNEVTSIGGILAGGSGSSQPGLTLYVFDNDLAAPGTSTCNGSCASSWPPLLVNDGIASGVAALDTITRNDSSVQATHNGRPLYFFAGDSNVGDTNGDGAGGVWHTVAYSQLFTPLFDSTTTLEPELQTDTGSALITRLSDRARDRHAREDQFKIYDHYLSFYWEHRTAEIEIVDTVGHGGDTITFNVTTEWPLHPLQGELRFFHVTEAIYANNGIMTAVPSLDVPGETRRHYTRSVSHNQLTGQPFQVGDRMEFELSQFLTGTPNGRDNYYGTAILYVVGQGVEPFEAQGAAQNSFPMPAAGRLGGDTTLNYQYSDEPDNHFMQMPTNLSNINGQTFVLGRRVHHTDFGDGSHDEAAENSDFTELANTLGTNYINRSCIACHARNGRAIPPAVGQPLDQYVVKVGDGSGAPDAQLGAVLQPQATSGSPEGGVTLSSWTEANGLRSPVYSFSGVTPTNFSARIAPQLVGLGLLEAIDEADIVALADETDSNGDGISGRLSLVTDAATSETRIGRFGWKASQPSVHQQVASALNTDVGVMTSVMPNPDCGSSQTNCGASGAELSDEHLEDLTAYIALLGVSARRDLADAQALQGETLFASAGCNACHVDTFQTSPYHPHAELRDQTIHPYTDLLLHDMGPGLASTLTEGSAAGSEWRTAPLWNIGLTAGVSFGEGYLHDGRARTLHEAIMWHGGEASASQQAYDAMSAADQAALIKFLESL